jgi:hypothetical protein
MAHATVATTNTVSSSQLVFSFIASVLLFSEVGTPAMILGVVLVMGGIIVAQVDRSRRRAGPGVAPVVPEPIAPEPVQPGARTPRGG